MFVKAVVYICILIDTNILTCLSFSARFGYNLPFVEQRRVTEMELKLVEIGGGHVENLMPSFFFFLSVFLHVGINPFDLSIIV